MAPNENLLTVQELSCIINIKPKTIYQWAEMHQIPHYKLGRCVRFDPAAINQWLESCKTPQQSGNVGPAKVDAMLKGGR